MSEAFSFLSDHHDLSFVPVAGRLWLLLWSGLDQLRGQFIGHILRECHHGLPGLAADALYESAHWELFAIES